LKEPLKTRPASHYIALLLVCTLIVPAIILPASATTYYVTHGPQVSGGTVYSVVYPGVETTNPVPVNAGTEWTVHIRPATGWKVNLIYVTEHNQPERYFGHSNPWGPDDIYTFYDIDANCNVRATFTYTG